MPRLVSWKKIFHGKPRIFTRQILRGAMRVHASKSEVINERYCKSLPVMLGCTIVAMCMAISNYVEGLGPKQEGKPVKEKIDASWQCSWGS